MIVFQINARTICAQLFKNFRQKIGRMPADPGRAPPFRAQYARRPRRYAWLGLGNDKEASAGQLLTSGALVAVMIPNLRLYGPAVQGVEIETSYNI